MLIIMALLLAVAAPLAAEAPQTKVYRIGLLLQASPLPAGAKGVVHLVRDTERSTHTQEASDA